MEQKQTMKTVCRMGVALLVLGLLILASMFVTAVASPGGLLEQIQSRPWTFGCVAALVFFMLFVYFVCMYYMAPDTVARPKDLVLLCAVIFLAFELDLVVGAALNIFLRPYALIALLLTILYNKNTGIFTSIIVILIVLFNDLVMGDFGLSAENVVAMFLGFASCLLLAVANAKNSERFRTVLAGISVAVPSVIVTLVGMFMYEKSSPEIWRAVIYAGTSPILSVMLFLIFLPLFEKVFNVVTGYRLYELTDPSAPLMKMLKETCPGTFNHSIVVANLAEACAYKIDANPQLARAAGYYHDVGKMIHPEYFVENQMGGANPHDDLTPEMSTSIIRRHGINGYEICLEHNIPAEIADVCVQHHGTLPITYFYMKAQKFTEGELDIDNFRYDGPKPQTKVAAIIMIADACEAAIRASASKDIDKIEEIVRRIIEQRIDEEQFTECNLTFKDVYDIKDAIVTNYTGIYHERLKYPKLKLSKK